MIIGKISHTTDVAERERERMDQGMMMMGTGFNQSGGFFFVAVVKFMKILALNC